MAVAAYVAEDNLLVISGRRGSWPYKGLMPQCKGIPGQGSNSGWIGEQQEGDEIGCFQRGNQER